MPNQRRQLLAYCERREWEVVEEYDDAKTGTNGARREFQRLIERATDGSRPFDVIVVYAFSRFFRDEIELELTVRLLRKHGVRLVSITQEVRDDPTGNLVRRIFALFDEYDSVETGKHVARSLAENARQGFWNGSRPPFGYKTVVAEQRGATLKKRLAMNPVEARIVREVFDRALKGTPTGHTGVKAITSWLNDNGYRTRGGAPWGIGPVHRMLTDTIYKGQFIFNRDGEEPIAVPAPSIINTRLFDDVQEKLKSRSPKIKPPRLETSDVLLSGVAKCAGCGGSMTLRTGKSGAYRYYACSTAQRIGKTGCRGRAIPMSELDEIVSARVAQEVLSPKRARKLMEGFQRRQIARNENNAESLEKIKDALADAEDRLRQLYSAIAAGAVNLNEPTFANVIADAINKRDIAQAHVDHAAAEIEFGHRITEERLASFVATIREKVLKGPIHFRRRYLRSVIDHIIVDDDAIRISARRPVLPFNQRGRVRKTP